MPRQGQSVENCIITAWHKKVGDAVAEGDTLFSYETDKSAFDEPSPASGTVLAVLFAEGDVVECLKTVCVIGEAGEDISALVADGAAAEAKADAPAKAAESEAAPEAPKPEVAATAAASDGDRVFISPRAKNLALTTGADLSKAEATGPHGRIIERDVNKVLDAGLRAGTAAVEAFLRGETVCEAKEDAPAAAQAASAVPTAEYTDAPLSNVRRAISKAMHASLSEMAQLTLNSSFDCTVMNTWRARMKENGEAIGLSKITVNDMILFAVSRVLMDHPEVNAAMIGDSIRTYAHANVGVAVDTDRGLLVPTLFAADKMSLAELSAAAKAASAKARDGKLTPDEMSGGSFTVSNLGTLGVESFTPVINPPQVAILGVCAVTNRLRADGSVYPAMGLSLTFDHRALDGAPAARFLKDVVFAMENFGLILAK
jgi:pyruvate dehydrogenase E2 component (dihydrolipoamide acetyltransferase)